MDKRITSFDLISKPRGYERINTQLARWRCYVVASGRNTNRSDITLEAIQNAIPTIYNMPMVAHLKKKEDGSGWMVGAHDWSMEWDDNDNLTITDLTVPYGVVPENCNPVIEDVLEPDGVTVNKYLVVDVIGWVGRYNIMDAAYSDDVYFNQSCEILVDRCRYDGEDYQVIEEFRFSALCLLGKSNDPKYNKSPCFPSARVERIKYSLDEEKFRQDFALLMQEVKNCALCGEADPEAGAAEAPASDNADTTPDAKGKNFTTEEEHNLSNKPEILFADVCDKIKALMSETTYRSGTGKDFEKYIVLSVNEENTSAVLLDRESGYVAYSVPYIASATDGGLIVSMDYENKTGMKVGAVEDTASVFNVAQEIDLVSKDFSEHAVNIHSSKEIDGLNASLKEATENYTAMKTECDKLKRQLEIYEKDKEQFEARKHKDVIDALIQSRREEMGRFSNFLEYSMKIDYSKDVPTVERELKDIHYDFMVMNNPAAKKVFSAIETEVSNAPSEYDVLVARYGEENAKHFRKNNGGKN